MPHLLNPKSVSMILKKIFFLLVIIIGIQVSNAQSYKQYLASVNTALLNDDHYNALQYLRFALKYDIDTDSLSYLAGESARKLNALAIAESYYRTIINTKFEENYPEVLFQLGSVLFQQAKYNDASSFLNKYLALGDDDKLRDYAKKMIASSQWAKDNIKIKDPLLKVASISNKINTTQNEVSPIVYNGDLYISTMKYDEKNGNYYPPRKSSRILKFKDKTYEPAEIESGLTDDSKNIAHLSFTKNGNKCYFTQCEYRDASLVLDCAIYVKEKNSRLWGTPIKLGIKINEANSNSTQPHVVVDKVSGKDGLYFVSDRKNGKGGTDIYYAVINNDNSIAELRNLSEINTSANEYSPYFNKRKNTLFFSSDGHLGFGGQDIYRYAFSGKDSAQVVNLGSSLNSSYDDLYFSADTLGRSAYMSSNRPGSAYIDEEFKACCFDIYKVDFVPAIIDLQVNTYDKYDSSALNNVTITLVEIGNKNQIIYSGSNPSASIYDLKVTEDKNYKIIATKNGFISDSVSFSTIDPKDFSKIIKNLYLVQEKKLNVATFERTTNIALKGVKVQLWDNIKHELVAEYSKLDSNTFDFTILKGTEYLLIASKKKYESDSLLIKSSETAKENILNRKMYLELTAIAELRRLLPIKLFFDNDMPNPKSESDTTNVLFSNIYQNYLGKKGLYMFEYTNVLKEPQRTDAILDIDTFFEYNVRRNAEKLNLFMDKLIIIMEEGHSIDIFLKGYASPRAKSEYNQHLSSRRVNSIRNEFNVYNGGGFHPYIKNENLKIKEIPFGESQSSIDVSDSIEDVRNSIYSLKAAYERRVEILEILKGVDDK